MAILLPFPPYKLSLDEMRAIVDRIKLSWPAEIICTDKLFGASSAYTCRSILETNWAVIDSLDHLVDDDHHEIYGIVAEHVGSAIKHSSMYLTVVRRDELDTDTIIRDLCARDDIVVDTS